MNKIIYRVTCDPPPHIPVRLVCPCATSTSTHPTTLSCLPPPPPLCPMYFLPVCLPLRLSASPSAYAACQPILFCLGHFVYFLLSRRTACLFVRPVACQFAHLFPNNPTLSQSASPCQHRLPVSPYSLLTLLKYTSYGENHITIRL